MQGVSALTHQPPTAYLPMSTSITEEQRNWLMAIRDHLSVNIEIRPEDMMDAPEFSGRGGIVKARALFGARLPGLLDELTDALVA